MRLFIFFLFGIVRLHGQHFLLNDEFDRPCNLQHWQNINITEGWDAEHLESHDINISHDGQLTMVPYTSSWYAYYRGTLIYKVIAGNFIFETTVIATNRSGIGLPSSDYSLAGMMIRTPKDFDNGLTGWLQDSIQNYVFLSVGWASTNHPSCQGCPGPHFEIKNTVQSQSNLEISSFNSDTAIIRMIRIDGRVAVLSKAPGDVQFEVRDVYNRQDMPDSVQVGFVTYTDWPRVNQLTNRDHNANVLNDDYSTSYNWNPDLIGRFDYARFEDIPAQHNGMNLLTATDQEILDAFSYDLSPVDPLLGKIWKGINSDWTDPANWSGGMLPTSGDTIVITDCSCDEVNTPIIPAGQYQYASMITETGSVIELQSGAEVNIDLSGIHSTFNNQGQIINHGQLVIQNGAGKEIINEGVIHNVNGSMWRVGNE